MNAAPVGGLGGTNAGNPISVAAANTALEEPVGLNACQVGVSSERFTRKEFSLVPLKLASQFISIEVDPRLGSVLLSMNGEVA